MVKRKAVKRGRKRKVTGYQGVVCAKCGKVIPKGRKAVVVRKGLLFGLQDWYYHPSCYKKIYKKK